MPIFRVYRVKRYEATVEAFDSKAALEKAVDIAGKEWILAQDEVEDVVVGLDTRQRFQTSQGEA